MEETEESMDLTSEEGEGDPPLYSIWGCKKLERYINDNAVPMWKCLWCPKGDDGEDDPGFKGNHATKALRHVCQLAGGSIRACKGQIPPYYRRRYMSLYLRNTSSTETRKTNRKSAQESIEDSQARVLHQQRRQKRPSILDSLPQVISSAATTTPLTAINLTPTTVTKLRGSPSAYSLEGI